MDSTTIWIIIAVLALLALFFYNRSRSAPRGAYDDKNTRSSGSIGGGTRAYDDKNTRSSGSIGGGQRGYDSPEHESRGSIGGNPTHQVDQNERDQDANDVTRERIGSQRQYDDEHSKSKGSIGG
jgi:hypothetical protein